MAYFLLSFLNISNICLVFQSLVVLDWSLLISIALRDALGVVRTINSARDQSPETIRSLRDGLMSLALWANTQWSVHILAHIVPINNLN